MLSLNLQWHQKLKNTIFKANHEGYIITPEVTHPSYIHTRIRKGWGRGEGGGTARRRTRRETESNW